MSTITIATRNGSLAGMLPGRIGQRLPVGTACDNFKGYCDALNNCFTVDNEGMREGGRGGGRKREREVEKEMREGGRGRGGEGDERGRERERGRRR